MHSHGNLGFCFLPLVQNLTSVIYNHRLYIPDELGRHLRNVLYINFGRTFITLPLKILLCPIMVIHSTQLVSNSAVLESHSLRQS